MEKGICTWEPKAKRFPSNGAEGLRITVGDITSLTKDEVDALVEKINSHGAAVLVPHRRPRIVE